MTTTNVEFNEQKSEAFAEKMVAHMNGAALGLMVSIAHRTGLFDAMSGMNPASSSEIAEKTNLNERYVREGLGAFVTGGIVEYDAETKTYWLPPEHAAWLTRDAVPNNLASPMQWIAVLGGVEDEIVECFKKGGGLKYEQYKRFHEVMADESYQTSVHPMLEHIVPLIEKLREKLETGIEVMDLGCGSGAALIHLAKHFPQSSFTGYDLCQDAIDVAEANAREQGVSNIRFETRDVTHIGDEGKYDLVLTFDAIHDQAKPDVVLKNIHDSLKEDGYYLMQDIAGSSHVEKNEDHPIGPFLYTISCMHCTSVSLQQGGAGLGAMWGKEKACELLKGAGFSEIEVKQLEHDLINYYYIVKK